VAAIAGTLFSVGNIFPARIRFNPYIPICDGIYHLKNHDKIARRVEKGVGLTKEVAGNGISIALEVLKSLSWPNCMSSEKEAAFYGYGSF
jgi:hypothetical protein